VRVDGAVGGELGPVGLDDQIDGDRDPGPRPHAEQAILGRDDIVLIDNQRHSRRNNEINHGGAPSSLEATILDRRGAGG
jgi:hypothetical protein